MDIGLYMQQERTSMENQFLCSEKWLIVISNILLWADFIFRVQICLWCAIRMKNACVLWWFWLKIMAPSIYTLLYTLKNTYFHLHYFILFLTTAPHDGQEFVAYPHFMTEEIEDKRNYMTYLRSQGKYLNQCTSKVLGTESWDSLGTWSWNRY